VELGFLSNAGECRLLLRPDYQQRLAAAMADGVTSHLARSRSGN
jgi:N-acetylmuramoyl-L-alanine amidase